jgi:hypothetical protein
VNVLHNLDSHVIASIKYLRVVTRTSRIQNSVNKDDFRYQPAMLMTLFPAAFPALCIERFTILADNIFADTTYYLLNDLIAKGNGWRELYCITPNTAAFGFRSSWIPPFPVRRAQPGN